jgi:hypothetical protein
MTQVRSNVRGQIRSPVRGQMTLATGSGESFHDGISFNARTGRVIVKAPGASPQIGTLASFFTFTGGNQSMYMGPAGLLVPSVTNTPRIEYDANGNCLGLLMEAARTNLAIQSFDLSAYTLTGITVGSNVIAGPDGAVTADSMIEDASTGLHRAGGTSVGAANVTNTCSFFVKAGTRSKGRVRMGGASGSTIANFDLVAKTITPVTPSGNGTCTGATITELANGWFRVTATGVPDSTSGLTFQPSCDLADAAFSFSYTGTNATIGAYCTGFQVEAAAFASSYIPTTTVSVARTADSCIRTLGAEFSATAGAAVVTGRAQGGQSSRQTCWAFTDGTTANTIPLIRPGSTDSFQLRIDAASVNQAAIGFVMANNASFKAAAAWAANDAQMYIDGLAGAPDAAVTLPAGITTLGLGVEFGTTNGWNGHIKSFDYYPTRLANNMLQQMSA